MRSLGEFLLSVFFVSSASAAGLKKVLVLDFININKDPNYNYLEGSLTDAVKQELKKRFAFKETPEAKWQAVAEKNFIYRQDYYTLTAAMNLGLLARQDVVIAGGFRVQGKKNPKMLLHVLLLDISKKKVIAEFDKKAKIDNNIFTTIEQVAKRISDEAKAVLPSKEEWAKSGLKDEGPSEPFLDNFTLGLKAGGGIYALGLGDRLTARLPAVTMILQANMPFLWEKLHLQAEGTYMQEEPKEGKNPKIDGIEATTTDYIVGGYFLVEIGFSPKWSLLPKLGGGYMMQTTQVTSPVSDKFNNGLAFAAVGFDTLYALDEKMSLVFTIQSYAQFDSELTLLSLASFGVHYRF